LPCVNSGIPDLVHEEASRTLRGTMNDNLACGDAISAEVASVKEAQVRQLEKSKALAGRAVTNPETMTSDEVQEIGWGFLVALKRLRRLGVMAI
jgi:transcription initiation factor TFIIIB Brf1 subunit/transcription initiation factor TFIIB